MNKITLYTCETGVELHNDGIEFWASKERFSGDYEFIVNEDDVIKVNEDIYEVPPFVEIEWTNNKNLLTKEG